MDNEIKTEVAVLADSMTRLLMGDSNRALSEIKEQLKKFNRNTPLNAFDYNYEYGKVYEKMVKIVKYVNEMEEY